MPHGEIRKRSRRVELLLLGAASVLSGCYSPFAIERPDLSAGDPPPAYATKEECEREWGEAACVTLQDVPPDVSGEYAPVFPAYIPISLFWGPTVRAPHIHIVRHGFGGTGHRFSGGGA